jgi:uncharacterized protein
VILVDANLLLYAKFADFPQHQKARAWLEAELSAPGRFGIPWQSSLAFLRLATNPRLFGLPLSIEDAWAQVSEWLSHPRVWVPEPTGDHERVLGEMLSQFHVTGNLVPDAHLAAIAVAHGLVVCSADSDFARFRGVEWKNPLNEE